ncbi:MAG: hypothetical protein LBJ00_08555 [Planctomycetaceae bacterium]|nr:hypothetical protein [Planctomycetaceae bacterium]
MDQIIDIELSAAVLFCGKDVHASVTTGNSCSRAKPTAHAGYGICF